MLSKKHLQDICMLHRGANECRYLHQDDNDYTKHCCLKLRQNQKDKIDAEVVDYLKDCKKKGFDPMLQSEPIGDNCSGYPFLKVLEQGYDKGN